MKKSTTFILVLLSIILFIWIMVTLWVQKEGPIHKIELGSNSAPTKVLIIYDPDPFYNLDQQICEAFGSVLANHNFKVTIATVAATKHLNLSSYQLYVLCSNTYNWDPDWAIVRFIDKDTSFTNKKVIAITLGSGATIHAQKTLEKLIKHRKARLIDSKSFWLKKPNDTTRIKESNVKVALEKIEKWAFELTIQKL